VTQVLSCFQLGFPSGNVGWVFAKPRMPQDAKVGVIPCSSHLLRHDCNGDSWQKNRDRVDQLKQVMELTLANC
jgi:hypothetical protein